MHIGPDNALVLASDATILSEARCRKGAPAVFELYPGVAHLLSTKAVKHQCL